MEDLGRGSGPNTLLLVREVIDIIRLNCQRMKTKSPIFQAFLNDLPLNDFNSVFNSLPSFYEELERENGNEVGQCFVSATVGSFYGRLFPPNSLCFVHSSYCLHWRSKVPERPVTENGIALNRGNICVWKNSNQKEEIEEAELDSFNVPFYSPTEAEVKEVIEKEGSFSIRHLKTVEQSWDPRGISNCYQHSRGKDVSMIVRAVNESVIASHLGHQIFDSLFQRSAQKTKE